MYIRLAVNFSSISGSEVDDEITARGVLIDQPDAGKVLLRGHTREW